MRPSADSPAAGSGSTAGAVAAELGSNPWLLVAALVSFLGGSLSTFIAMQTVVWDRLRTDLLTSLSAISEAAATSSDLLVLHWQVALFVGTVLAVEMAMYGARDALPRWWTPPDGSTHTHTLLVAVGASLFPLGAAVGYVGVVPTGIQRLAASGLELSLLGWAQLACVLSLVTGLAVQTAFVLGVLILSR